MILFFFYSSNIKNTCESALKNEITTLRNGQQLERVWRKGNPPTLLVGR